MEKLKMSIIKMETVFQRINRKCREAKKKLILIKFKKKKRSTSQEPYIQAMSICSRKGNNI
jgi:hypothetical protein